MLSFFTAFNWFDTFKAAMVLFAVIDIVGTIPIIIDLKQKTGNIHPLFTTVVASLILIMFLILGESILMVLGVDIQSFAVAGSLILFAMSLEMILGVKIFRDEASGKTASIVPLAFPLIAGAGSMTTIVALRAEFEAINIIVAIVLNMILVYFALILTKQIERILGVGGMAILKKVFGIILLAIAVKLFTSNFKQLFLDL
jgi:multiple antibiotic resistance protein